MSNLPIKISVKDLNVLLCQPEKIKELRRLTLNKWSGLNYELNKFEQIIKKRKVKAKAVLAYHKDILVGWALLSKEKSDFIGFIKDFCPYNGYLFQVYILPKFRRKGIATKIFKVARRKASPYKLNVVPYNISSSLFYNQFKISKSNLL